MRLFELLRTDLVYHGGPRLFRRFTPPRGEHPSKVGVWFTEDRALAEKIARMACRMADDQPILYTCRLDLQQPAVFETYRDFLDTWGGDAGKVRRKLMRQGHDGVEITRSDTDGGAVRRDFAVFSPDQIEIAKTDPVAPPGGI